MWSRRGAVVGVAAAAFGGLLLTDHHGLLRGSSGRIRVGFAQTGAESGWRTANTASVTAALSRQAGFDLTYVDGQDRQEDEIAAIRGFITRGMDVIAFAPLVETGWREVLLEARAARIPVVLEDRGIDPADAGLVVSRVGDDFEREGRLAGRWVASRAGRGLRIVELLGTTGSSAAVLRSRGFAAAIAGAPVEVLDAQDGGFSRAQGKSVMAAFLEKHGGAIDLVFAQNDDMGLGALLAIEEAGLVPGRDIRIVTIDGTKEALAALAAGRLAHVVQCDPLLGPRLAEVVRAVHERRPVAREYIARDREFDRAEARSVLATWPY